MLPSFSLVFNFCSFTSVAEVIGLVALTLLVTITILSSTFSFFPVTCCFFLLLVIWCFINHYIIILLLSLGLDIPHFYWNFIFYDFSNILHQFFIPFISVKSFRLFRSILSVEYMTFSLLSNILICILSSLLFVTVSTSWVLSVVLVQFLNGFVSLYWCGNYFLGWIHQIFLVSLVICFLARLNSCYMWFYYVSFYFPFLCLLYSLWCYDTPFSLWFIQPLCVFLQLFLLFVDLIDFHFLFFLS